MHVILRQYSERDLQIIDVVEDQGTFLGIAFLRFEECMWVIAPVTERVEVVRGVVAVVEAEAVRLQCVNSVFKDNNPNLLRRVGIET